MGGTRVSLRCSLSILQSGLFRVLRRACLRARRLGTLHRLARAVAVALTCSFVRMKDSASLMPVGADGILHLQSRHAPS